MEEAKKGEKSSPLGQAALKPSCGEEAELKLSYGEEAELKPSC